MNMKKPDQPEARELMVSATAEQLGADALAQLTDALESALTPQEPREAFARELRAQLLDEPASAPAKLRRLSGRLPFVAAMALAAGCLLLMLRRLLGGHAGGELVEETVPSSA